jgi:16S rRNA (cytosine1402-N4)-methyltransferase
MNATILPEKEKHYPVLLNEIVSIITPQYGGTFIDCTFGQGGYTKKILEYSKSKVIALDRDKDSKNISLKIKKYLRKDFILKIKNLVKLTN